MGIDVSKKTLDAYCHQVQVNKVFVYETSGYKSLIKWVLKVTKDSNVFYCFENTGYYSLKLALYLHSQAIVYVAESPLKIKRSSGVVKEKTDLIDSILIAGYAWLYREELNPSTVKSSSHLELGRLLALRDQIVRNNAGLKGTLKELKVLLSNPTTDCGCISLKRSIDYLEKQVKAIETRIKDILSEDASMSRNYERPPVSKVLVWWWLVSLYITEVTLCALIAGQHLLSINQGLVFTDENNATI